MKHIRRTQPVGAARRLRYFTMIEVLAVIAIILILVGLSFGAYNAVQKSRANARTESSLSTLNVVLQAFKTKYGYFPQTDGSPYPVYVCKGVSSSGVKSSKFILGADAYNFLSSELLKSAVQDGTDGGHPLLVVTDGFKDPVDGKDKSFIYYRCPGETNKDSYDLLSAGPDRKLNTNDDIWPQNQKKISGTK